MLMIPIQTPNHTEDMLIVVLDGGNLERMAHADPAEVQLRTCGKTLVNPAILICHEEDSPELARLLQQRDIHAIVKFLQRGFEFRPDKGDHDNGRRYGGIIDVDRGAETAGGSRHREFAVQTKCRCRTGNRPGRARCERVGSETS